jgi:hypothetical protein
MAALDPQCRMLLDVIAQQGLPELHEMGVAKARAVRDAQRLPGRRNCTGRSSGPRSRS